MNVNVEKQLEKVVKTVEHAVDEELERLEQLSLEDYEALRQSRLKALKEKAAKEAEWRKNGHGSYDELKNDREFFDMVKKSEKCAILMVDEDSDLSRLLDHHLKILAPKIIEAKFAKIYIKRCPFLKERFQVAAFPALVLVKDLKVLDKIYFRNIKDISEKTTTAIKDRIASTGFIDDEDIKFDAIKQMKPKAHKTIRDSSTKDDSDDDLSDLE